MSGLGLVLSIAKDALAAQTFSLDVVAHNIANVSTPGYSRQHAVQEAREPSPFGGLLLGRGVTTVQVVRSADQLIENQLMNRKANLASAGEMENYMRIVEGLFNENTESSISVMLADFWAKWHDVSNNPTGASERTALHELGLALSEQFNLLYTDLARLETDLTNSTKAGIGKINQITAEIAQLNDKIAGLEAGTSGANDLRDKRNTRVSELSEFIDVKSFEQHNGSLTIVTARGGSLVVSKDNFELELGGSDGKRVQWTVAGGASGDLTNRITKGRLGGWLEMRDGVLAQYKLDLDAVAKEFIWAVNQQHAQGAGLRFFNNEMTGTYKTGSSGLLSTLAYGDKIDYTKDFRMWIDDGTSPTAVTVDMGISTASVTDWGTTFATGNTTYTITVAKSGNISEGVGATTINWREGSGAWTNNVLVNADGTVAVDGNTITFDPTGTLVAGNTLTVNTIASGAASPTALTPSATANSVSDTYTLTVTSGGTIGTGTQTIDWSNSETGGTISITAAGNYTVDGMTIDFASGTLVNGDVITITTDTDGSPTADLPTAWHWTLNSFSNRFNNLATGVAASVTSDYALRFTPIAGYSYGFSDQNAADSGLAAALGLNTFFQGDSARSMGINTRLQNRDFIAAAQINNNVGLATAVTGNTSTGTITTSGPYTGTGNGTYTVEMVTATTFRWRKDSGAWSGASGISIGTAQTIDAGVTLTFNPGAYVAGDSFTIAVTESPSPTRMISVGNNTNALAIADLQYASRNIEQWTTNRISTNSSGNVSATLEDYYHSLVGSIGIKFSSISRDKVFNEEMVHQLGGIRDSISAVSLDEEMIRLIQFQSAYMAATKLLRVADEMLQTLINAK